MNEPLPHPIPAVWTWTTVGQVAVSMKNGIYKPRDSYAADGIACLRMYNIEDGHIVWRDIKRMRLSDDEISEYGMVPGDILVNRVNSRELVGKAAAIPLGTEQCVYESKNIRLRLMPETADPRYTSHWFSVFCHGYFAQNAQQTVGMASINQEQLGAMPLPLPPLPEQHRIVAKVEELFSDLDAGVETLKKTQALLKRYRQSVLKAAFMGKLTAKFRLRQGYGGQGREANKGKLEPASVLLERIQAERVKHGGKKAKQLPPVDTSDLAELPKGWGWARLGRVAAVDVGLAFKSAEFVTSGIRLLRGENIEPGSLRWHDTRYWPDGRLKECEHLLIQEGEIILAMDRPVVSAGLKIARAKADDLPCLLVQRVARVRPPIAEMTGYVHLAMNTQTFIVHCLGHQTGTQLPHISSRQIEDFTLPVAPLLEQAQIVAEIERRFTIADQVEKTIEQSLKQSQRLRQSILKRAFSGRLVPQDPKDEPASVLLERIKAGRAAVDAGGRTRQKRGQ